MKIKYKGIELLRTDSNIYFINKTKDALKLGIFAGYSLKDIEKKIDKNLKTKEV